MRERQPPITDVAIATAWWAAFANDRHRTWDEDWVGDGGRLTEPREPYRAPAKIGRNEPCPCGSGKKYKKCCGLQLH